MNTTKLNTMVAAAPFGHQFCEHLFIADFKGGEWIDHGVSPLAPMSFLPAMSALNYGQSVFEGMKAFRQHNGELYVFRLHDHWERLNRSAVGLFMPPIPENMFRNGLLELLAAHRDEVPPGGSLYIRPVYFATDELLGVKPSESYRLAITIAPAGTYYEKPIEVWVEDELIRAAPGGVGYIKAAGNYAGAMRVGARVRQLGFDVVLWLDAVHHRTIEEFSTMNAAVAIDGQVLTPPVSDTILRGITRDSVLRLLHDSGIPVEEHSIDINMLTNAVESGAQVELFGIGTAAVVAPAAAFTYHNKRYELSAGKKGSVATWLKSKLDDIRSGIAPDPYGWLTRV